VVFGSFLRHEIFSKAFGSFKLNLKTFNMKTAKLGLTISPTLLAQVDREAAAYFEKALEALKRLPESSDRVETLGYDVLLLTSTLPSVTCVGQRRCQFARGKG
jgi:hypothetical protein